MPTLSHIIERIVLSNYRRKIAGGRRYFFTVVTYKRRQLFCDDLARSILKESIQEVKSKLLFEIQAFCLMPDHLHCIWKMAPGDSDYSKRWSMIKRYFSKRYTEKGGTELSQSLSRQKKRELGVWQRRFWEHLIRDNDDFYNHVNYIHYNPVKHRLVNKISDWPYSTYHQFLISGYYKDFDWNLLDSINYNENIEFNE